MVKKLSDEEVARSLREANWEPIPGWRYQHANAPIPGRCTTCGFEDLRRGPRLGRIRALNRACSRCGIAKRAAQQRLSQDFVDNVLAQKEWVPEEGWVYENSQARVPGRCQKCGFKGPGPAINHLLHSGTGACEACSGRKKVPQDEVLRECRAKDWEPDQNWVYQGSGFAIPGRCTKSGCGYTGTGPSLESLRGGQGACLRCAGKEKTPHEEALRICIAKYWNPEPGWQYDNAHARIPGQCVNCGYEGPGPTLANIKNKDEGACFACSERGFNPSKPAWLYCLWRESDAVWQIGITSHLERRNYAHERSGFRIETVATRQHSNGDYIWQLERDLLRTLKDRNVRTCKELGFELFSGYQESWPASEFTPPEVKWGDEAAMLAWLLAEQSSRDWTGLE